MKGDVTMPKTEQQKDRTVYFQSRNERGLSRERASEELGISPERIERIENEKAYPHPDEVMVMADKYGSPELINHYCSRECPIGQRYIPHVEMRDLSRITLEMLASINAAREKQDRLIAIAADGEITLDELRDFAAIRKELRTVTAAAESLRLWTEKMIGDGKIDPEKLKEYETEEN